MTKAAEKAEPKAEPKAKAPKAEKAPKPEPDVDPIEAANLPPEGEPSTTPFAHPRPEQ